MQSKGLRLSRNVLNCFVNTEDLVCKDVLVKAFTPTQVTVADVSGGCGSMYNIFVESAHFSVSRPHVALGCVFNQTLGKAFGCAAQDGYSSFEGGNKEYARAYIKNKVALNGFRPFPLEISIIFDKYVIMCIH
jgi:hypothetical protein